MHINRDELRRARRRADAAERRANPSLDAVVHGMVDEGVPVDALMGGLTRRRFFGFAGFSVASAAVIAACGGNKTTSTNVPQAGLTPVTTALPERIVTDVVLLRTASSLEHNAIETYATLLGMLTDQSLKDMVTAFRDHHQAHAASAESATKQLGGEAFTSKNPVVDSGIVQPALKLITDGGGTPADIVGFVYALETVATQTYQSFVPILTTPKLRSAIMLVGGAEARHATIAAGLLDGAKPVAPLVAGTGATAAATTTTAAGTTTTLKGGNPPPVYQVPGTFQPQTPVEVGINRVTVGAEGLGPNSYMYVPAKG